MERFDTTDSYHAWYEHWHRYHWMCQFIKGQRVADLACGEGYGSALMATVAKQVTAMDLDEQVVARAQQKYNQLDNLHYQAGNILNSGLPEAAFDLLVSFETLEHLAEHDQLIREFRRLLRPGGVLVISTPDKRVYSANGEHNEHHVRELEADEFKDLMAAHFEHSVFFGQQLTVNSHLHRLTDDSVTARLLHVSEGQEMTPETLHADPTYLLAVVSDDANSLEPFINAPAHHLFNESGNHLYQHYEQQIKTLLATDERVAALELQLKKQTILIHQLQARLGL